PANHACGPCRDVVPNGANRTIASEEYDESELLEVRPYADAVCRLSLLRPELHGLVRARPTWRADRCRSGADYSAARLHGGHADSFRRDTAAVPRHARRPYITQKCRPVRAGRGDRRAGRRVVAWHPQLRAGLAAGAVPRHGLRILCRGAAASIGVVSTPAPGHGDGHRRGGQFRNGAGGIAGTHAGDDGRLEQRLRSRTDPAGPDPAHFRQHGEELTEPP